MNQNELKQEWIDLSKPWIEEARRGRNPTRTGLLDEPMLRECGDVSSKQVLDCGCGEGRFCRILANRHAAYVLGIDLCEPMIRAACEYPHESIEYRVADVQNLSFLTDNSFDVTVSYLNQCDLPDYQANTREVFRVLKPGGRFVIANLHPMKSAVGGWCKSEDGIKQHAILDRYFDQGERKWNMMGVRFTNYHRTLSSYLNCFLETGFILRRLIEPTLNPEQLLQYPELDDELRVPNFIVFHLIKPGSEKLYFKMS